jgi:type I restriction enzyme S subunit
MDAQQFLAEFGYIAHAPNGIEKLRELILVLALQGRLLQQRPGEDAAAVLETIGKERQSLIASGALRSPKPLPAIAERDRAHAVPANWCWTRFGEIALHNSGKTLDSVRNSGQPRKYITTSNLYWGRFDLSNVRQMLIRDEELEKCTARKGDLLICEGGEAGRAAVWFSDEEVCFQNHVHRARFLGKINPFYAYRFFEKLNMTGEINEHRKGISISNMSSKALAMIPFPLPPLAEQDRIVAKVEELMAMCSQLEQQQQDRRKLENALRQATLQAFASAQSPHELRGSWRRLQDNFRHLFSEPADVDDFIAELKNLAVRGVLVEASRIAPELERITTDCSALRSEYIANGLMRRQKLVGMAESDVNYPENWAVAAFDEVAVVIGGVTKGRDLRGKRVVVCPYLAVANVQRGYFKLEALKSIEIAEDELAKYQVQEGDLLITEGGDWDKVGRTAIWPGGVERCLHQNHVFKARVPSEQLLEEWVELVFNSGVGRDYFAGASKQTTNLASINMTQLRSFPLPIPPVKEQRCILNSLAALNDLCEGWRRQLEQKRDLASLFAAASVAELTGVNIEQDDNNFVAAS